MDLDAGLVAVGVIDVGDGVGVDLAVVQFDTVGDALHVVLLDVLVGPYVVDLLLDELGVSQFGGQVAVVGQQEHTGGVTVQAAYGIDTLLTGALHQVEHGGTAVGIVGGGDAVLGLVQEDVALALGGDDLAVELHYVGSGDLGAQFGYDLVVDLHQTGGDTLVGLASGADTGVGHELVQTDRLVGVEVVDDVVYLLGTGDELFAGTGLEAVLVGALVIAALAAALLVAALVVGPTLLVATLVVTLLVTALVIALLIAALIVTLLVATLVVIALLVTALALLVVVAGTLLVAALLLCALGTLGAGGVVIVVGALLVVVALVVVALVAPLVVVVVVAVAALIVALLIAALALLVAALVVALVGGTGTRGVALARGETVLTVLAFGGGFGAFGAAGLGTLLVVVALIVVALI